MEAAIAALLIAIGKEILPHLLRLLGASFDLLTERIRRGIENGTTDDAAREAEILGHVAYRIVYDVEHADPPAADKGAEARESLTRYVRGQPQLAHLRAGDINRLIELAHGRLEMEAERWSP
jgi:hypothetical protein